jgi:hypothetical protein
LNTVESLIKLQILPSWPPSWDNWSLLEDSESDISETKHAILKILLQKVIEKAGG